MSIIEGALPRHSVSQIEQIAADLIAEHYGTGAPAAPIDIESVLEAQPGVCFDIMPGLVDRYQILGLVYRRNSELLVLVDAGLADRPASGRYRCTVGEELGHVVLHRAVIDQVECAEDFIQLMQTPAYGDIDNEARRLSAAVLMPSASLERDTENMLKRMSGLFDPALYDAGEILTEVYGHLARSYKVSNQSMSIRATQWPHRIDDRARMALAAGASTLPARR